MAAAAIRARGFTYLGLLFAVALIGVTLAAAGSIWSTTIRRDKEVELLFIGNQFRDAIGRYYEASPGAAKQYPRRLEDLLLDPRYPTTRRHLRKVFVDPFRGSTEWGIVKGPGDSIMGVFSTDSREPLKKSNFSAADNLFENSVAYSQWKFVYLPAKTAAVSGGGTIQPAGGSTNPTAPAPASAPGDSGGRRPSPLEACELALGDSIQRCEKKLEADGAGAVDRCIQYAEERHRSCIHAYTPPNTGS
jgi:type II secretory pathway pseudopilin PulG